MSLSVFYLLWKDETLHMFGKLMIHMKKECTMIIFSTTDSKREYNQEMPQSDQPKQK